MGGAMPATWSNAANVYWENGDKIYRSNLGSSTTEFAFYTPEFASFEVVEEAKEGD